MKCCICKTEFNGYGNNPAPLPYGRKHKDADRCCDECNFRKVIPFRMMADNEEETISSLLKKGEYEKADELKALIADIDKYYS